jgi:hypothetical protein
MGSSQFEFSVTCKSFNINSDANYAYIDQFIVPTIAIMVHATAMLAFVVRNEWTLKNNNMYLR